jgi:AbrB family looped-hinge helix DNA binding protein
MSKEQIGESRITTKGQVTLPKNVRELLNAEEGDYIIFYQEEGKVFIEAGRVTAKPKVK